MSKRTTRSAAQRIIEKAQARGSHAATAKGALAYLLSNLPLPIPGLAYLSDPGERRPSAATARRTTWDKAVSWTHDERADKRAAGIAERVLKKHPGRPFSKVRPFCRKRTADIAERVTKHIERHINWRLAQLLAKSWPYSRSHSRWAGGRHFVSVTITKAPNAAGGSHRVWSSNGKWSGTNSNAHMWITPAC